MAKVAGPLWVGPVAHAPTLKAASRGALRLGLGPAARVLASLEGVADFPPWSFSAEEACSRLRIPSVPVDAIYLQLERIGRRAMRTPFEKSGVKTDATYREFLGAVMGSSMASDRKMPASQDFPTPSQR